MKLEGLICKEVA